MYPGRGTLRGASARGASFKPILHQNMSAPPGRTISIYSPPSIPGSVKRNFDPASFTSTSNNNNVQRPGPDTKPMGMQTVLIDRYKRGELNPVSTLYHLSQTLPLELEFKETVTTGNTVFLYFAYCAIIDGVTYKTGMGKTKKEAKSKSAELALEELLPVLEGQADFPEASGEDFSSEGPPPLPVKEKESTATYNQSFRPIHEHTKNPLNDQIPQAVKEQLFKLMKSYPEFSSCIGSAAAFIIQSSSGCEVIAIGTGNFNTRESAMPNGRILHDSHAVVAARRSLMRYLYQHLLLFFSKSPVLKQKSIFEKSGSNRLLGLKSDISLHLFISQLPKGAAQVPAVRRLNPMSMSAWEVSNQISLHLTVEGKVFSVFSCTMEQWDSKVVSMSVTDKLSRWQVLGYQGALLSHFIEPLYVKSILVGDSSCSNVKGMEIAVCQRVEGITPRLPMYYCMLQPHISLLPSIVEPSSSASSQRSLSVNWTFGDSVLEVVDGLEGKTVEESPFKSGPCLASRLCKAAMLSRFTLAAKEAERQDLLATVSYREAKMMAKPYQEAKSLLKSYLQQQGYGSWVHKSPVSDQFSL